MKCDSDFSWPLRVDSWPLQAIAGHDDVGGRATTALYRHLLWCAGCTAWRIRRALTGEGPGEVAGVRGPACGGCGHVDRLITWPDSRRRDRSSGLEQARSASAAL